MSDTPPHLTPPATVVWAYRLILGREPESDEVVEGWARGARPAELRDQFLASAEMAALRAEGLPLRLAARPLDLLEAATAALALTEGTDRPDEAEARRLAATLPSVAALRRHVLRHPAVAAATRTASAGVRHILVLADGRRVALQGDAEEVTLRPLAARFAALEALARRELPESGAVIVDGEADIGVASLLLLAARPGFAALRAFERDVVRAMRLVSNLAAHAPPRAKAAAVGLPPLGDLHLPRVDLLRLPSPARLEEAAPWIAQGTLVVVPLRLRDALAPGQPAPAETLRGWAARFSRARALGADSAFALDTDAAIAAALALALDDPERRVDVALGGRGA